MRGTTDAYYSYYSLTASDTHARLHATTSSPNHSLTNSHTHTHTPTHAFAQSAPTHLQILYVLHDHHIVAPGYHQHHPRLAQVLFHLHKQNTNRAQKQSPRVSRWAARSRLLGCQAGDLAGCSNFCLIVRRMHENMCLVGSVYRMLD